MANLLLVHFALIPGPVRKERQFRLPDDFSGLDFTIPPRASHSESGFPALFRVFTTRTDRCSAMRNIFLHDEDRARNFNIFALRCKIRRLNKREKRERFALRCKIRRLNKREKRERERERERGGGGGGGGWT